MRQPERVPAFRPILLLARRILLLVVVLTASAASLSAALRVSQRALDAKLAPRSANDSAVLRSASMAQGSAASRSGAATTCSDADESIGELSPDFLLGTGDQPSGEDSSEACEDEESGDTHDMDEIVARGLVEIPAGALAAWLDHETSRLTSIFLSPEPRPARCTALRSS